MLLKIDTVLSQTLNHKICFEYVIPSQLTVWFLSTLKFSYLIYYDHRLSLHKLREL